MECEKCGTWNPDDKIRCWRCSADLPKPPEPRRSRKSNTQTWLWVVVVMFFVLTTLFQCGVLEFGGAGDSTGFGPQPFTLPLALGLALGWPTRVGQIGRL